MPLTSASSAQSIVADHGPRRVSQQPGPPPSPTNVRPIMLPHPADSPTEGPSTSGVSLPSLTRQFSRTPPTPSSDRRPANTLPVQSILNPPNDSIDQRFEQRNRRLSGSQINSPSPVPFNVAHSLPPPSRPNSVDSTQGEEFRRFANPVKPTGRHMPSPRSPKAIRTTSITLKPPTGTMDAHQMPFLSPSSAPRSFIETSSTQPSISAPPAVVGYFPPTAPTPPPGAPRVEFRRASASFPQSGNASPIHGFSPYQRPSSIASGSQYEPSDSSQPGSFMNVASSTQSQDMDNSGSNMEPDQHMIPMAPSGQSSYQLMTIKSQRGHDIQIPVDVQAASRVADEKRKRNAGASARFRARRKEKEREANTTIQNLQQQLREASEDVEYYRRERDFFREQVLRQHPGADRMYTRAPSPRHGRPPIPANPQTARAGSSGDSYSGYSEAGDPREPERNVRRRTSSYHPPPGSVGTALNGSGPAQQGFPGTAFPAINPPPPPQSQGHPIHPYDRREQRQLPEMAQPPPQLRDPFAANRNWAPNSGPENRR